MCRVTPFWDVTAPANPVGNIMSSGLSGLNGRNMLPTKSCVSGPSKVAYSARNHIAADCQTNKLMEDSQIQLRMTSTWENIMMK